MRTVRTTRADGEKPGTARLTQGLHRSSRLSDDHVALMQDRQLPLGSTRPGYKGMNSRSEHVGLKDAAEAKGRQDLPRFRLTAR
jgi:hypothetical protein